MSPVVTEQDDRVPRRRRPLVAVAVLVPLVVCVLSWPRVTAGYSASTANTGNGLHVVDCLGGQLFGNPGFETGTAAPWAVTFADEITNSGPAPRTGRWNAVLDLDNHTDKRKALAQTVAIPRRCPPVTFSFWLRVQTNARPGTGLMSVQVLDLHGTVLATLASFPHTNTAAYQRYTYDLTAYRGQTVTVRFYAVATGIRRTTYVIDDTALTLNPS